MKKMKMIILMLLLASPGYAQEVRKNVEAKKVPSRSQPLYQSEQSQNGEIQYKVNCFVTDDRDGDRTVVDRTFTIVPSGGVLWTENFCVKNSDEDLQMVLAFDSEEKLFYLMINDLDAKITAQNVTYIPDGMYVFLGTEEIGLIAQCNILRPNPTLPKTPQQLSQKK